MVELTKLSHNKNVVVCKPDNGRGVVLLDRSRYLLSKRNIIGDTSKFVPIFDNARKFSLRIEDKIKNFLRKLKSTGSIAVDLYKSVYVTGSAPGIILWVTKNPQGQFSRTFPVATYLCCV